LLKKKKKKKKKKKITVKYGNAIGRLIWKFFIKGFNLLDLTLAFPGKRGTKKKNDF
jgi:hypothetical protein